MRAGLVLLFVLLVSATAQAQGMPGSAAAAATTTAGAAAASSPTSVLPVHYRIELRESARVTTETVYLRDVAQIVAVGPDEDGLASLGAVEVGRVPLVGQTIRIPAGYVLVKLRQARVRLDNVSIEFPPSGSITVNRAGADAVFTDAAAKATATATITGPAPAQSAGIAAAATANTADAARTGPATVPGAAGQGELAVLVERARADLIDAILARAEKDGRPAGASWEVEIDGIIGLETQLVQLLREAGVGGELPAAQATESVNGSGVRLTWDLGSWVPVPGRFTLFARLKSETSARDYPVTVYGVLKMNVTVVVARSPLPAGKLLGPEDVELKPMDSDRLLAVPGVLTRLEDAYGRELQRSVAAGEPVRSAWLTAPLVFRRGDRFPVAVQNGSVTVTVLLEALEDGRVGALVRCRNVDTGRIVMVRVTPEGPVPTLTVVSN